MEFFLKNKKLFALSFWIWLTLIIAVTIIPYGSKMQVEIKENSYRLDYFFHFLVYFGLAILYLLWRVDYYFKIPSKHLAHIIVGGLALSYLSEYAQIYIPGRTFNPLDFYSNASGVILGVIIPKIVFIKLF